MNKELSKRVVECLVSVWEKSANHEGLSFEEVGKIRSVLDSIMSDLKESDKKAESSYEMETLREIWPKDGDGEHVEVGPDRDGFGYVEIRQENKEGKITERMTFSPDIARGLAKAIVLCADGLKESNE